jgi:hypothetical protein
MMVKSRALWTPFETWRWMRMEKITGTDRVKNEELLGTGKKAKKKILQTT